MKTPPPATKACNTCNVVKPNTREFFYHNGGPRKGLRKICVECTKKRDRERHDNAYQTWRKKQNITDRERDYGALTRQFSVSRETSESTE